MKDLLQLIQVDQQRSQFVHMVKALEKNETLLNHLFPK